MALNTSKCNHLLPLHFKGLTVIRSRQYATAGFQWPGKSVI